MDQGTTQTGHADAETEWGKAKQIFRRLGPAGWMALAATVLPPVGLAVVIGTMSRSAPWLRSHGDWGPVIYAAAVVVLSGLAIVPTYAPSVLGGWAFGFAVGFPTAITAFLGASLVAYVIVRRGAGDRLLKLIEEKPKWRAVHAALLGSGFWKALLVVTLVRLMPNSPFALTNFALSAMRVNVIAYGLGTLFGLAPRTAFVVYAAAGVAQLDFKEQKGQAWTFIGGLALTAVLVIALAVWAKRAMGKVTGEEGTAPKSTGT